MKVKTMVDKKLEKAGFSIAKSSGAIDKANKYIESEAEKKLKRIREFRREASRLASMANKRLQRLEGNKLTDSPAYRKLVEITGKDRPRFSVRGKDYNELQREVARMRQFLNAKTSTVRGATRVLKDMAQNIGIKYKTLKELKSKAKIFFELSSKIEQYLRTVEDIASAIGYQRIWEAVNEYTQREKIDLSKVEGDIDGVVYKIIQAMDIYNERENFNVRHNGVEVSGWFQLNKDE